jgi:hypothetical protein
MEDGSGERRLADHGRQSLAWAGMDKQAEIGPHMVDNAVGLEEKICAAPEPWPELAEHRRKIGGRRMAALGWRGQQGAHGSRS